MDFRLTLTATAPLLMHNSRLANPIDPATKALKAATSKRVKTDEDHEEIAHLEFLGSLYTDSEFGPYVPGQNIERCLVDGAKLSKNGVRVTRGVFIKTDVNPLAYNGPRNAEELWADENFRHLASVKVGTSRMMRCRPVFREWRTEADGVLDTAVLNVAELAAITDAAGAMIGLGDWRPRFGRFTATVTAL